jgi:hypothetical protein
MSGEASGPSSSRDRSLMRRVTSVVTVVFWVSAALMTALVGLSWAAPGVRDEQSFLRLSGASVGLTMFSSGFLFWQENRANRQVNRTIRRENRDIRVERRARSGPPKRGSTQPPLGSPSSSRGTCCQPCSCPESKPPAFEGKRRPLAERSTKGKSRLIHSRARKGRSAKFGCPHSHPPV